MFEFLSERYRATLKEQKDVGADDDEADDRLAGYSFNQRTYVIHPVSALELEPPSPGGFREAPHPLPPEGLIVVFIGAPNTTVRLRV